MSNSEETLGNHLSSSKRDFAAFAIVAKASAKILH